MEVVSVSCYDEHARKSLAQGMSWLSENIGSCPKCRKALIHAEPKVYTVITEGQEALDWTRPDYSRSNGSRGNELKRDQCILGTGKERTVKENQGCTGLNRKIDRQTAFEISGYCTGLAPI